MSVVHATSSMLFPLQAIRVYLVLEAELLVHRFGIWEKVTALSQQRAMSNPTTGRGTKFLLMKIEYKYQDMNTNSKAFRKMFFAVGAMLMLMSGCNKEEYVVIQMKMPRFQQNGKVYMDQTMPRWTNQDVININNEQVTLTVSGNDATGSFATATVCRALNYKAIFPSNCVLSESDGSVSGLVLPKIQNYIVDASHSGAQVIYAPMCAQSASTALRFKNLGAVLAINIVNPSTNNPLVVDYVSVSSANQAVALWGNAEVHDFSSDEPYYTCSESAATHDSIYLKGDSDWDMFTLPAGSSKVVYVYLPRISSDALNRFAVTVYTHTGMSANNYTMTQTTPGVGNVRQNELANIQFTLNNSICMPDAERTAELMASLPGVIPGAEFTVKAASGSTPAMKVYFSKGNLQWRYTSAGGEWRFATNQYDYVGYRTVGNVYKDDAPSVKCDNELRSATYEGWIDFFGWGTSGYHDPADTYNTNYFPWSSASTTVSSLYNEYGYGPSTNSSNLDIAGTEYDWGVHNAIVNGGNATGRWRTLTYKEWNYMLNSRTVGAGRGLGYCYSIAIVQGVRGIIIYPDGYTNQLPANAVLSAVPEHCAFLPCAGCLTSEEYVGDTWYYWSASQHTSSTPKQKTAITPSMLSAGVGIKITTTTATDRYVGCSVRLVQDI